MKRVVLFCLVLSVGLLNGRLAAQEQEVQQLLLNVEKLAQMKEVLSQLKQGYEIVAKGYLAVKNVSEGNFSLHKAFLDGLMEVSPVVRSYYKVPEIIKRQLALVKTCKTILQQVKGADLLADGELDYLSGVVDNLLRGSLKHIEALALVLTAGELRMSDAERLEAIDNLWNATRDQQTFLGVFSAEAKVLMLQRQKERYDQKAAQRIFAR